MITLSTKESEFYQRFLQLKNEAGSHSPSIFRLLKEFPEVSMSVDACFLCNPYAFNIFYERLQKANLESYVKFYPPQNEEVARNISQFRGIPSENILIGNGAIEIIENLFKFAKDQKVMVTLPTFSTYYEVGSIDNTIVPYQLSAGDNFKIDPEKVLDFIKVNNIDIAILVNPNNPTGSILTAAEIIELHQNFPSNKTLVIDESFIDFSTQDNSIEKYAVNHNNIIIVRSMSKDFGIAGLRVGYAVMNNELRKKYLASGFLWNSNGLAYFFTTLLADTNFQKQYLKAKNAYNEARDEFFKELSQINGIRVYPSQANFFMIETEEDSGLLFSKLLYNWGIYTRILNDKAGLTGNFLRIASKDQRENRKIINALQKIYNEK